MIARLKSPQLNFSARHTTCGEEKKRAGMRSRLITLPIEYHMHINIKKSGVDVNAISHYTNTFLLLFFIADFSGPYLWPVICELIIVLGDLMCLSACKIVTHDGTDRV